MKIFPNIQQNYLYRLVNKALGTYRTFMGHDPLPDWYHQARENQRIPPGDWRIWLIIAGRGFGKTRTGAETIRHWVKNKVYGRIALVGETAADVRDVMIEGCSGILATSPPDERPTYMRSKRRLEWPNGAIATAYSADAYDQMRGPQFDCAWVDELAKFTYGQQAWDQLMLALRLGTHPRCIVTTTPRPLPLIKELMDADDVVVTRGSTHDNAANLAPDFIRHIVSRYENSTLGAQEIYGDIVDMSSYRLWPPSIIRYQSPPLLPHEGSPIHDA